MSNQIILTEEGKAMLEAELKVLKEEKRPEIISKIEQAKEMGDLSENAEYHDAKDQQGMMEARINEIEDVLKKAIVSNTNTTKDNITLGSSFVVQDNAGNKKEFTLVGFNEADPIIGKISNESPMGQAFKNKKVNDIVEIDVPKGLVVYKVVEIK